MSTYTYPSGFVTGQHVWTASGSIGRVTFPGGGNGTAPGWVAVDHGLGSSGYIGVIKHPAADLTVVVP